MGLDLSKLTDFLLSKISSLNQLSYLRQVYIANRLRKLGDAHFQNKKFPEAIRLYDTAIDHIPEPLRRQPYHPNYATLLASRASACIALAREQLGAPEASRHTLWNTLTPSFPQDVNTATLIRSVLRLVHYYLSQLNGRAAGLLLDIIKKYKSEEFEYTQLASRIDFLSVHDKKIKDARSSGHWSEALNVVESLEKGIISWNLHFNLASLPGSWSIWKAQALVRLGRPLEAANVLSRCDLTHSLYKVVWQEISKCNQSHSHSSRPTNNSHSSRPTNNAQQPKEDPSDPKGYYRTLGVSKDADIKTITKVFRKLSKVHHPDKGGCTEVYQRMTAAYSVLSKVESRETYDSCGR
ncbi:hypothetical protein PCANC_18427 [Puccinia coronata f. sp. avenae]|uniref:J domain-containing protein n=1 Tax=Puccinia coronata f. sp. avenae TaxID=200324 RepID=A0A2N5SK91_9BASI|nr:hypothetical protein PCANC_18427 [Puccinia coronata f. sp. avenae]